MQQRTEIKEEGRRQLDKDEKGKNGEKVEGREMQTDKE